MDENISRMTDAQLLIERCVEMIHDQTVSKEDGLIIIDPDKIDAAMPKNFVIYEIMSAGYGFRGTVVDELFDSLMRGATGKRFYARDWVAYIDRGRIIIDRITDNDVCETELTTAHNRIYCGNSMLIIRHTDIDNIDTLRQPENSAL